MAYTGDLRIVTEECEDYRDGKFCDHDPEHERRPPGVSLPVVFLPHSCNEWVIGGATEVRALIDDLKVALAIMDPR